MLSAIFYLFIIYRGVKLGDAGTLYAMVNIFFLIKMQLYSAMGIWDVLRSGIIAAKQLEENIG
ncbi:hypothetical protein [Marinitoga aeolica]|uniref:Uncharacterized protein n=1 Tax=Marinitoga aeolica TaxID=2809031 RepID=A0ABY8PQJ1_9BACT|nr:hypothetical protein [Marinitoga aeolica]WGS64904.1 hypothetical protein JRV97_11190 [Marinitoga aeolica]